MTTPADKAVTVVRIDRLEKEVRELRVLAQDLLDALEQRNEQKAAK